MCICCCVSHLHSLCMPCAARAHRVVVGCGIVAASVPHRCLYDPWNPLISQLQAPEAASCTDMNALPQPFVGSTDTVHHEAVAMYYCLSPSASGRSLHQVDRVGFRIVQAHVWKERHVMLVAPAKVASCFPGGAASAAGGQVGPACRACFRMSACFPCEEKTAMKAIRVKRVYSRCIAQ